MKIKLTNLMYLFLGCLLLSAIAWYITPFIETHTIVFIIGATSSWTGLMFSLFMIPSLSKAILNPRYLKYFYILMSCFSISLGSWLIALGTTPDNLPFLFGSLSSTWGAITLIWLLIEFNSLDKRGIALFEIQDTAEGRE